MFIGWRFLPFLYGTPALFSVLFTYVTFVFSLLIVIAVYDFRHGIIPDTLVWGFNAVAFAGLIFIRDVSIVIHTPPMWAILAGPIIALPFLGLWFFSKGRLMGLGDVKLMLGIGWLLGISSGILAIVFSFWIGAIVGVLLLLFRGRKFGMKSAIPFGPFLVLGTVIVFFMGIDIYGFMSFFAQ